MDSPLQLRRLPDPHWVVKLEEIDDDVWALQTSAPKDSLWSVSVTHSEVSVVSTHSTLPHQVASEGPWSVFEVAGPLDFALVGVLHKLATPLVAAGISVFVISTFDTDYALVPHHNTDGAVTSWVQAGVTVSDSMTSP